MWAQRVCLIVVGCAAYMYGSYAIAAKYAIESELHTRAIANDNIFLSSGDVDNTYQFVVAPELKARVSERNWDHAVSMEFVDNRYSDQDLNNTDTYLNYSGVLGYERHRFTLNAGYNKDSNLSSASSDFGITGRRVKSTGWNAGPAYEYFISPTLQFSLSANHSEKDYADDVGTGFVGYKVDFASSSLRYFYSERTQYSVSVQFTDYVSDNDSFEYELLNGTLGVSHQIAELWSTSVSLGRSRRLSTNRETNSVDFLGQTIVLLEEIDFKSFNTVANVNLERKLQDGSLSMGFSIKDETNSFGGLNEVLSSNVSYHQKINALWTYTLSADWSDVEAVTQGTRTTDRETRSFTAATSYRLARNWRLSASYRYFEREFLNADNASSSNRISFSMSYIFPEISTY